MTEKRKLAAVMFTDIIGYTALMSQADKDYFPDEMVINHFGRIIEEQ